MMDSQTESSAPIGCPQGVAFPPHMSPFVATSAQEAACHSRSQHCATAPRRVIAEP